MIYEKMTLINRFFGWKDIQNAPKQPCVIVFGHSSFWDIFVIMIYCFTTGFKNLSTIVQPKQASLVREASPPKLEKWYYFPLKLFIRPIYASPNEKRNNNSLGGSASRTSEACLDKIAFQFIMSPSSKTDPRAIMLSPKGTCSKSHWRSGYYHLAKKLNIPIVPVNINYSKREIIIEDFINPYEFTLEQTNKLIQEKFGKYNLLNPENAEYSINDFDYCPYESIFPFDLCAISLLTFIPYLLKMYHSSKFLFYLDFLTICFSYKYHIDYEGTIYPQYTILYQEIENLLVKICIMAHVIYWKHINIYLLLITLFFYMSFIPRGKDIKRRKYAILNPIFNILLAITATI
jgi:hypothetical protein